MPLLKVMLSVLVSTVGTATDPADDVENWKDLHDVGLLTGGMIAAAGAAWYFETLGVLLLSLFCFA